MPTHAPLPVIVSPPSEVTFPPSVAPVVVMPVWVGEVIVGVPVYVKVIWPLPD